MATLFAPDAGFPAYPRRTSRLVERRMGAQNRRACRTGRASPPTRASGEVMKEIWIEWGGRLYGPYASPEEALKDGFHLKSDLEPAKEEAWSGG